MANSDTTNYVVRLDDTNFDQWSFQIKLVLDQAEVWGHVNGDVTLSETATDNEQKAWNKANSKAKAIIGTTISRAQISHLNGCDTAKEFYDRLKSIHSDSSVLNKQHTMSAFFSYRMSPDQSILEGFTDIETLALNLNSMGIKIDESMIVSKIVSSLPDVPYLPFKKSWDSVPDSDQTLSRLHTRLKKEQFETKQLQHDDSHSVALAANGKRFPGKNGNGGGSKPFTKMSIEERKKITKCKNCNKKGHWYRECRAPKAGKDNGTSGSTTALATATAQQNNNSNDEPFDNVPNTAFMVNHAPTLSTAFKTSHRNIYRWISDSGASQHITGVKDWFIEYSSFEVPRPVWLTDNQHVEAKGTGTVKLEAYINQKWVDCYLHNVLYIPGAVNLFSEGVMVSSGYTINRNKEGTFYT